MIQETTILHWFYFIVMLVGSITIWIMSKNPKKVPKIDYFLAFFIPLWSALAYMSIAIGQGFITISNKITFFARYIDWIVTTPMLLLSLALTAMYYVKKDLAILIGLCSADIIMVLCGLLGDLSTTNIKYAWFLIGMIAFFVVIWLIWFPLKKIASTQSPQLYKLYKFLLLYLTIFWIGYPTGWILGPSGIGILSQKIDTYIFIILPIFSKVGFGILNISGLKKLN